MSLLMEALKKAEEAKRRAGEGGESPELTLEPLTAQNAATSPLPDLAQHFAISAALAAWAGEPLANTIGLDKEVDDARGGSGFSFADLAADRAGTRFGELAVRQPARLAAALAGGLGSEAIMPATDGLPEPMQADAFRRRFGHVGSAAYQQVVDDIEQRIAALALFSPAP